MNDNPPDRYLKFHSKSGRGEYFSRGILAESLYSIGMDVNTANDFISLVESKLVSSPEMVSKKEFLEITLKELEDYDEKLARRYRALEKKESYQPIIILLAGVPGIGKSTLASHISQRLEISNIIGTDMIREILRQSISEKLVPELYGSSYEAYKYVIPQINPILDKTIVGYEEQSRHIIVGVEAAIQSSLYSRENIILEGVHLAPNILKPSILNNEHLIMFLLYLDDREEHLTRFHSRAKTEVERQAKRYVDYFEQIRNIQKYLIEESNKAGIIKIETKDRETCIGQILEHIWERVLKLVEKREKKKEI